MDEYRRLVIATLQDSSYGGIWGPQGLLTRLDASVSSIFRVAQLYGAMDHIPERISSFNNPDDFNNFEAFRRKHPNLAKIIKSLCWDEKTHKGWIQEPITKVRVYEARLLDDKILEVFKKYPYEIILTQYDENKKPDFMEEIKERGILVV